MKTSDFDYTLPPELIAQTPLEPRDRSRLMVVKRAAGPTEHRHFGDIGDYLREGDVLVFNDSRVIAARLNGKKPSGGRAEVLLLRRLEKGLWEALVGGKGLGTGSVIEMTGGTDGLWVKMVDAGRDGVRKVQLSDEAKLLALGKVPLPPYIHAHLADPERYQTVYSRQPGSAAAPTAGLHFTPTLLDSLARRGVELVFVTLHIGLDTFRPVKESDPAQHVIHTEYAVVSEDVAARLSAARREGRRIIAVGTTSVRVVEHVAASSDPARLGAFEGWVDLFILPGHRFRMVDAMITNFHLPRSTLIMLVSAFAGKDLLLRAYHEAMASGYRFYSFGDAMLVL